LNNEPVVARPPSRVYRLQKLVRRNKMTFAAIAAVSLSLLTGLGISTWLFLEEREARQRAVSAEQQQIRLREEADQLRLQAENRQKLTQATVFLSRDKIEEADRMVTGIPASEPNLEYAALFRTLGDWHASNGRWQQASDRFAVLLQVNQPDDWDITTLDYLRYGPLLLELGDTGGYERFRHTAVTHFAKTSNPVAAERVIKMSLLTPADQPLLDVLHPLAEIASNSLAGGQKMDPSLAAWRSFSLALLEYRSGNRAAAESWCQRSITYQSGNAARTANLQLVLAMTHFRVGKTDLARSELAQARAQIESRFSKGVEIGAGDAGFWFDWIFARVLLREATANLRTTT
jgi:hypothetical protein